MTSSGDVALTRLAVYSPLPTAMPVSSRLGVATSSYSCSSRAGGGALRSSSLERAGLAGIRLSGSRLTPSLSGRRPPLPAAASPYDYRRSSGGVTRASPGRPPPLGSRSYGREPSADPETLSEARRYLQERRERLTRSESREPAGGGSLRSPAVESATRLLERLDSESTSATRRWRSGGSETPSTSSRERIVPISVAPQYTAAGAGSGIGGSGGARASGSSVSELRRQFDSARLFGETRGEEETTTGEATKQGGRAETWRPASPPAAVGAAGAARQRTVSGSAPGDKWEQRHATLPRQRRPTLQQQKSTDEKYPEEPGSPLGRRSGLLSEREPAPFASTSTSTAAGRRQRPDRTEASSAGGGGTRLQGLTGLRNIGNTCFMNSVLQCLSNTRALHDYILRDAYASDINGGSSATKGALIKAFAALMSGLWRRSDDPERVLTTAPFKAQIQRFAPRFVGYQQQDAQEFLRYLLEGLHEDVNRVTSRPRPITTDIDEHLSTSQMSMEAWKRFLRFENSKFVDLFVGQLKSTLRCTVCGHASVTFDPFWDLSLPIPSRGGGQQRLQACFDLFTREEVLDGDEKPTCSRCQKRQKCTKSFSIQKFPRILVVHLKRFSPAERFRGKLSMPVDFPISGLDLSAYSAAQAPCKYNLYGVANHSGTVFSGHYTAYCRHPHSGEWYEYNDSRVRPIPPRAVSSSEAYVLFYELAGSAHL